MYYLTLAEIKKLKRTSRLVPALFEAVLRKNIHARGGTKDGDY